MDSYTRLIMAFHVLPGLDILHQHYYHDQWVTSHRADAADV
jgi:hypothetical protein